MRSVLVDLVLGTKAIADTHVPQVLAGLLVLYSICNLLEQKTK